MRFPDAAKVKSTFLVERLPFLKNGTTRIALPVATSAEAIALAPTFEPAGNVAPVAAIAIVPVPSELIVAPPRLIVSPAKNNVLHLFVAEPRSYVSFAAGMI